MKVLKKLSVRLSFHFEDVQCFGKIFIAFEKWLFESKAEI